MPFPVRFGRPMGTEGVTLSLWSAPNLRCVYWSVSKLQQPGPRRAPVIVRMTRKSVIGPGGNPRLTGQIGQALRTPDRAVTNAETVLSGCTPSSISRFFFMSSSWRGRGHGTDVQQDYVILTELSILRGAGSGSSAETETETRSSSYVVPIKS